MFVDLTALNGTGFFATAFFSTVNPLIQSWTTSNTVVLVLTVLALTTYYYVFHLWPGSFERMRDDSCSLPLPPGTMGWPVVGETLEYARKGTPFFSSRLARHGLVYKTHLLGCPTVRVVGAEHVRQVLLGEQVNVESKWPSSVLGLMGKRSLLNLKDAERDSVKKVLVEGLFAPHVLATFVPHFQAVMDTHLDRWCKTTAAAGHLLGFPACEELTISLTMEGVLGVPMTHPSNQQLTKDLRLVLTNLFSLPINLPGFGMWKILRARERILKTTYQALEEKEQNEQHPDGAHSLSRFSSLVERLRQFPTIADDPELLEDTTMSLIVTSVVSSASAHSCCLLELGRHPEIQKKLEAELHEFGLMEDKECPLTYDVIQKMTYVQAFVNEVLRVLPPAGACFRRAKKTLKVGGYQIPKGWTVMASIRETQETSSLFPDPDDFCPDRWLRLNNSDEQDKLRYHYLPFGVGSRMCIGKRYASLELYVFVVEVVRRCTVIAKNPLAEIQHLPSTRPRDNLPVAFCLKGAE